LHAIATQPVKTWRRNQTHFSAQKPQPLALSLQLSGETEEILPLTDMLFMGISSKTALCVGSQ